MTCKGMVQHRSQVHLFVVAVCRCHSREMTSELRTRPTPLVRLEANSDAAETDWGTTGVNPGAGEPASISKKKDAPRHRATLETIQTFQNSRPRGSTLSCSEITTRSCFPSMVMYFRLVPERRTTGRIANDTQSSMHPDQRQYPSLPNLQSFRWSLNLRQQNPQAQLCWVLHAHTTSTSFEASPDSPSRDTVSTYPARLCRPSRTRQCGFVFSTSS